MSQPRWSQNYWARALLGPGPFGPGPFWARALFGPGPFWARALLGRGSFWAQGPLGPWAQAPLVTKIILYCFEIMFNSPNSVYTVGVLAVVLRNGVVLGGVTGHLRLTTFVRRRGTW